MSELNNILANGPERERISEETLMLYLEGKLTPAQQHEVEKWLADEGMESDALEGLQTISPVETKLTVNKLNHELNKTLHHKKRKRRPVASNFYTLIAMGIILMLAIVAYLLIRKMI